MSTFMMTTIHRARVGEEALGVISTRPGILLGGNTVNGAPVAFSGRVPILVTNENGVVMKGDSLVVSASIPGYAMKMTEGGYSIGRALSDMITSTSTSQTSSTGQASPLATSTILMVVENKHKPVTITSLEGLSVIASSTVTFATSSSPTSFSVIDYMKTGITHGRALVTEYISYSMKAVTGYFDTLFAKEIYTDKVCVKKSDGTNICLTGDEVQNMMNATQIPLMTPNNNNTGGSGGGSNDGTGNGGTGTSTDNGNGTTTDHGSGSSGTSTPEVPPSDNGSTTPPEPTP